MKSVEPQDRQKWTFSVLLYDIQCEKMISNDSINIKSRVKILHMFSLSFALYHKIRKIANKKFNWEKTLINHVWKRNQAWKNEWKRGGWKYSWKEISMFFVMQWIECNLSPANFSDFPDFRILCIFINVFPMLWLKLFLNLALNLTRWLKKCMTKVNWKQTKKGVKINQLK